MKGLIGKENLIEQYEDSLFAILMDEFAAQNGQLLIQENNRIKNDTEFEFPDGFTLRIEKALSDNFTKRKREENIKRAKSLLSKVAIIFVACGIVFTTLFSTVSAFREKVYKFIAVEEKSNTDIFVNEDDNVSINIPSNAYLPTWLPDGYVLKSYNNKDDEISAFFNNNSNVISYYEYKNKPVLGIDTENADIVESVTVNDFDGILVIKGNVMSVTWSDNSRDKLIRIKTTDLDKETVLKIAESVKLN